MTTGNVERHMYTLYKEMIEDGFGPSKLDLTLSENVGYPVQAHHCISCSVMAKIEKGKLAKLAEDSGYDINNGNNGVALPAYFGHTRKDNKQRHRGGHWDDYYEKVAAKLQPIYDKHKGSKPCTDPAARKNIKADLETAEDDIKKKLLDRKWWLYDWSEDLYDGDYRDEGAGNLKSGRKRDGSSTSGQQWLNDYGGNDVKRRHKVLGSKKQVLSSWYKKYGYPVPGGLTS